MSGRAEGVAPAGYAEGPVPAGRAGDPSRRADLSGNVATAGEGGLPGSVAAQEARAGVGTEPSGLDGGSARTGNPTHQGANPRGSLKATADRGDDPTRPGAGRSGMGRRLAGGLAQAGTLRQLGLVGGCALVAGALGGLAAGALAWSSSGVGALALRAGVAAGLVCVLACALVGAAFVAVDRRRRADIAALAERVDLVLRDPLATQPFDAYGEGELAVLENELQKMATRLRDQAAGLQLERDALADSLADVSHQLRTPLAAIALTLELLGRPDSDEARRRQHARDLRTQVDHLSWLATTLLLLARADAKALRVVREPVLVADLVREAVEPLRIALELKGQLFEAHFASGDEAFEGDPGWSREALANILKNCMEHTPAGGAVRIEARRDALATRIVVSDTGPGISPADLPHVFERFYKGEGSAPGSAGIGLALARTLVAAQGGTLTAGNGVHGGARFELTFPHVTV